MDNTPSTFPGATDALRGQGSDDAGWPEASEPTRHRELLQAIRRPGDVVIRAEARGQNRWEVTVCTSDHLGALSIIAGLFAAYSFDIVSADIRTLHFPAPRLEPGDRRRRGHARRTSAPESSPPTRKVLDTFEVHALGDVGAEVWARFEADLRALVAFLASGQLEKAREVVIDRVSQAFRTLNSGHTRLLPLSVDLANDPSAPQSRLTVQSADTPGFLFAFTNALAGFTVNIERAQIRTLDGEAHDTFWVTDVGGQPITRPDRIHELQVATALIKQFTHLLPRSPDPGLALRQFNALIVQMLSRPQWTAELGNLESRAVLETLADLMGVSRFLWEDFLRMQHENLFPVLLDFPSLREPRTRERLSAALWRQLCTRNTLAERVDELNAFKDREMFRVDLRHITGRSQFARFAAELSDVAEVTVGMAAELTRQTLQEQFGAPIRPPGYSCPWCICALGKFGGRELGFGSDLELFFVYEGEGATAGPQSIPNSEYFERFVRTFRGMLRVRQEGIFEIDQRLQPYGRAGAAACSLDGFIRYYAEGGDAEQFERMALVRLRPVAGDLSFGERVRRGRDSFVYSGRPLDLENIRHLRGRQASELVAPGKVNAKYSAGGLVDVEYFVQSWQIVAGAADASVRVTNILEAIARLTEGGYFTPEQAEKLRESYGFLRRLIDALRVVRGNAKDLTIPPVDSREFAYLTHRLRYGSPEGLQAAITARMDLARSLWDQAPGAK